MSRLRLVPYDHSSLSECFENFLKQGTHYSREHMLSLALSPKALMCGMMPKTAKTWLVCENNNHHFHSLRLGIYCFSFDVTPHVHIDCDISSLLVGHIGFTQQILKRNKAQNKCVKPIFYNAYFKLEWLLQNNPHGLTWSYIPNIGYIFQT